MSDTELAKKLRRLIEANGPMSIAEYMAHCLGDPEHGYYTTRDPFGTRGDFITAPEVSQMFGEIVGAWLIEAWRLAGSPSPFRLVELGPGRGTLMADVLRVAATASDFFHAANVHLVETSPALKALQAKTLASAEAEIAWHSSFADVPRGPLLLVANEFFDALPIRQYVRTSGEWRERVVGLDDGGQLAFGIGVGTLADHGETTTVTSPLRGGRSLQDAKRTENFGRGEVDPTASPPPETDRAPLAGFDLPSRGRLSGSVTKEDILEINPAAEALIAEIAKRIVEDGGAALIIDYCYEGPAFGDTLQAIRGHKFADVLARPGETDLTAHVDFSALARRASAEGAEVHGPMDQGNFLVALGLLERAGRLGAKADQETREKLRLAVERLAGPDQMGTLFKAMSITRPGTALSPFGPSA